MGRTTSSSSSFNITHTQDETQQQYRNRASGERGVGERNITGSPEGTNQLYLHERNSERSSERKIRGGIPVYSHSELSTPTAVMPWRPSNGNGNGRGRDGGRDGRGMTSVERERLNQRERDRKKGTPPLKGKGMKGDKNTKMDSEKSRVESDKNMRMENDKNSRMEKEKERENDKIENESETDSDNNESYLSDSWFLKLSFLSCMLSSSFSSELSFSTNFFDLLSLLLISL